jgi:tRNA U34 5-methylaminomethyl-2-thiouridine-forming methyltransferase MnmC
MTAAENTVLITQDGSKSLYSGQYGVTYHSKYGAVTESAHVFIAAGLRYKAVVQAEISILETGFGTGLNALMSLMESEKRNLQIQYLGLETAALSSEAAQALDYPPHLEAPHLADAFALMHQCPWEQPVALGDRFVFQKSATPIEAFCAPSTFDIIYFDAFAPQAQPELWELPVLERMYASLRPDGVLVTYCAQGAFRRTLRAAGFQVEKLQGPPGKREMTRAVR